MSFVLDTNVLVHFIRRSPVWDRIRETYRLMLLDPRPVISVVTVGEIRSIAHQRRWGDAKFDQMRFALAHFDWIRIDRPAILDAYALIDAEMQKIGHSMGKNDVWIAATCAGTSMRLLTTDRDFDRLVPDYLERDYIDPSP